MGHADPTPTPSPRQRLRGCPRAGQLLDAVSPNKEFKAELRMFVRGEGHASGTADGRKLLMLYPACFVLPAIAGREIAEAVYQQLTTLDYSMPFTRGHPLGFQFAREVAEFTPKASTGCSSSVPVRNRSTAPAKMALAITARRGQGPSPAVHQLRARVSRRQHGWWRWWHDQQPQGSFGVGLPGVYHMRHTALPQNKFVKGQPEHTGRSG